MIKIYGIKLIQNNENDKLNYLMNFISKEKIIKINKYRKKEDFQRSLLSDVLIRSMIHRNFGISNDKLLFKTNEYGKPYLKDSSIYFNISHSGEWVLCALNEVFPVGIDIEEIRTVDLSTAELFMTETEFSRFVQLDEKIKLGYFYKVWTVKESYIKADGRGMTIPLKEIEINFGGNKAISVEINNAPSKCFFKQYNIKPSYLSTVCSFMQDFPDEIEIISIDDIISELNH